MYLLYYGLSYGDGLIGDKGEDVSPQSQNLRTMCVKGFDQLIINILPFFLFTKHNKNVMAIYTDLFDHRSIMRKLF